MTGVSEAPGMILCQKDFDSCICFLFLLHDQIPNKEPLQRGREVHDSGEGTEVSQMSVPGSMNVRLFTLVFVGQAGKQQARAGHLELTGVHSRHVN